MTPPKFEAYTDCPKCGRTDVHLLRPPKPPQSDAEMQEWRSRHTAVEVQQWGVADAVRVDTRPLAPVDESQFEVIRICTECGKEFGQV